MGDFEFGERGEVKKLNDVQLLLIIGFIYTAWLSNVVYFHCSFNPNCFCLLAN